MLTIILFEVLIFGVLAYFLAYFYAENSLRLPIGYSLKKSEPKRLLKQEDYKTEEVVY